MKIGIIETGEIHETIESVYGPYPKMFADRLHPVAPDIVFFTVSVVKGEPLIAVDDADGWIITGSRHGVYDDLPWIAPLKTFIKRCVSENVPIVGVCFGHQIMAEALGGRAEKSDKGWGLGVHTYEVDTQPSWMELPRNSYAGYAVHQDQVTARPPDAHRIAYSPFCENAALVYGDIERPSAISVQSHPEFSDEIVERLIDIRLKNIVAPDVVKFARNGLQKPVDNNMWAKAIIAFFRLAAKS